MRHASRTLMLVVALVLLALPAAAGAQKPAIDVGAVPDALTVTPLVAHDYMSLSVATPDGRNFLLVGSGGPVVFRPIALGDYRAPDGAYSWEVRLTPKGAIDPQLRARAARARETGDVGPEQELRHALHQSIVVQSGGFRILRGRLVLGGATEPQSVLRRRQSPGTRLPFAPAELIATGDGDAVPVDQVIPDDLIVQGSACVGLDCVNNENFGFDTLKLKENNTRIKFEDTSSASGFPTNDWQLAANDSVSGGQAKFSIDDVTGARTPFTIEAGSPTNSLYVDSSGRVGLRTATPVLDLHVVTGNTPATRLEQSAAGGFGAQAWDVAGNEANFFVRDVTGGSRLPLRIRPGAPTSSLDIASNGNVGIGTAAPGAKLHVATADATADLAASIGVNPTTGPAFNFGYSGSTFGRSSGFFNVRPDAGAVAPNPSIRFMTANVERMIIDNQGFVGLGAGLDPVHPLQMASGAHVTAGGVWTNASSRELKDDIRALTSEEAHAALAGLSPVAFVYRADPTERHVGFVAEDVPQLVATKDRTALSPMDIVAVLTRVVQEQQRTIEAQRAALEELAAQVSALAARPPR